MKSFGIPFFTPVAPKTNAKPDVIIEQPVFQQKDRMEFVQPLDDSGAGENPRGWTDGKAGDEE
jgi:spore germination protein KA